MARLLLLEILAVVAWVSQARYAAINGCIDINDADFSDLRAIPGIGKKMAVRIIWARTCVYTDEKDLETRISGNLLRKDAKNVWTDGLAPLLEDKTVCVGCDTWEAMELSMQQVLNKAVDVNIATYKRLKSVKGIGPNIAKRIIAGRTCAFECKADMLRRLDTLKEIQGFQKPVEDRRASSQLRHALHAAFEDGTICPLGEDAEDDEHLYRASSQLRHALNTAFEDGTICPLGEEDVGEEHLYSGVVGEL
eukprot:CAMPEP_0168375796 /NCGR_PEP_ID=MMETSP0228-20121227/9992_1 /TAXON_ID=133427 /ORGANISM="Protoceratium reticulatum, Strain CCCM 535 (=CCMP 1889)" /LENGTH=249 /DNA_ID=CAMNT_0008388767 /DNA_START=57 /DNA_END=806 /DNA_ORIENTATION=+